MRFTHVLSMSLVLVGHACKEKAPGPQELVWSGDREQDGGKGWANCDTPPQCKSEVSVAEGKGFNGTPALQFHGSGAGYLGAGWNWFGWWPEHAGTDLTAYNSLRFWMRVVVSEPNPPPEDLGLMVNLVSSTNKQKSSVVKLSKYLDDNVADGKWHQVDIPLDDFYDDAKGFDRSKVWEIGFGSWMAKHRKLDVFVDNIFVWEY